MAKKWKKVLRGVMIFISLLLISYPLFLGNFIRNTLGINKDEYLEDVGKIDYEVDRDLIDNYNEMVAKGLFSTKTDVFSVDSSQDNVFVEETLDFLSTVRGKEGFEKVIGYIDIPKIGERILLFYGTDEHSLERGAGILENTSFPSHKRKNIHTVLAGHRGMTNLNVFRHIDKLDKGDLMEVYIGDDKFVYRKTGDVIKEPGKLDDLSIDPNKNLLTVITCHPYLINNKRMMVFFEKV